MNVLVLQNNLDLRGRRMLVKCCKKIFFLWNKMLQINHNENRNTLINEVNFELMSTLTSCYYRQALPLYAHVCKTQFSLSLNAKKRSFSYPISTASY